MTAPGDRESLEQAASSTGGSEPVRVFISYRRGDDFGEARAIRSDLIAEFGAEHVFMDVADLQVGDNFVRELPERVAQCHVLLVVIGPRWAETLEQRMKDTQLTGSADYVRIEVETALSRRSATRAIPVVLGDTRMPDGRSWPASLRGLRPAHRGVRRPSPVGRRRRGTGSADPGDRGRATDTTARTADPTRGDHPAGRPVTTPPAEPATPPVAPEPSSQTVPLTAPAMQSRDHVADPTGHRPRGCDR